MTHAGKTPDTACVAPEIYVEPCQSELHSKHGFQLIGVFIHGEYKTDPEFLKSYAQEVAASFE